MPPSANRCPLGIGGLRSLNVIPAGMGLAWLLVVVGCGGGGAPRAQPLEPNPLEPNPLEPNPLEPNPLEHTLHADGRLAPFLAEPERYRLQVVLGLIEDPAEYPDHWAKFLLPGIERVLPKDRIRIGNKIGQAYGFSVENAYVSDSATGRAFFLAAVIYTNEDGILNDDRYEYEDVAEGFFADLGEAVARALWAPSRAD